MIYQKSNLNNKIYKVRNENNKQEAANILADIDIIYKKIISNLVIKNISYINLNSEYVLSEKPYLSYDSSYSIAKKYIYICLRNPITNKFHDKNVIIYVALHELAHVLCPDYGHGNLFIEIFKLITEISVELNLYKPINFEVENYNYCGITIKSSII